MIQPFRPTYKGSVKQRHGQTRLRLVAAIGFGVVSSVLTLTNASAADPQTDLATAWSNTNLQPEIQIDGMTSFSGSFVDPTGQTQSQGEDDTLVAQLEQDNGGYDELLKDSASGMSSSADTLFIQSDNSFYTQQGSDWQQGGKVAGNTLQDEAALLQNLTDVHAGPSPSGGVGYTGALSAQQIVTMLNNYVSTGPSQNPFDFLLNRILSESTSAVRIDTTTINGRPVVDEVQLSLMVTLSVPDTAAILGVGGDTGQMKPWQFHFSDDYKNAFAAQTFANPISGKTPSEPRPASGSSTSSSDGTSGLTAGSGSTTGTTQSGGTPVQGSGGGSTKQTNPATHLTASQVTKAYLDAFDIGPSAAQVSKWRAVDNLTFTQLIQKLRQIIKTDAITRKNITNLAYMNAFGRSPTDAELRYWDNRLQSTGEDYTDQMEVNRKFLESNDAMRQSMVTRSYQAVFWRGPTAAEMKYWDHVIQVQGMFFKDLLPIHEKSFHTLASMREGAIDNAYLTYLGTKPSSSELNTWSGVIQGRSVTSYPDLLKLMDGPLRQEIADSSAVRTNLVTSAYWTVFWRGPTPEELKYWDNRLSTSHEIFQDVVLSNMAFLSQNSAMRDAAINSAHMVLFGRNAVGSELDYWGKQIENGSIRTYADLVAQVKRSLEDKPALEVDTINLAYEWSFGRRAKDSEVAFWEPYFKSGQMDYSELVQQNRKYIQKDAITRSSLIKSSYYQVFHRSPSEGEYTFWELALQKYGDTYTELVMAHENWLKVNRDVLAANAALSASLAKNGVAFDSNTGNLVSTKTKSVLVPAGEWIIAQKNSNGNLVGVQGTGVIGAGAGNVIAAGGGNVIAAGSGNVIAAGGGNVIAAGSGNMMPPSGGNMVASLSGNLVQLNAAALLNPGLIQLPMGASVIGAGGGNVIGAGAGN